LLRFEFGKSEPAETFVGDFMKSDEDGKVVRIFRGDPSGLGTPREIGVVRLPEGQSVREISVEGKALTQAQGRKFR